MIHSQFKVTIFLVAMLMIVTIGAKVVSTLQPPNPALRGFVAGCEGKPQPCWYGIVAGETGLEDARNQLTELGFDRSLHEYTFSRSSAECTLRLETYGAGWEAANYIVQVIRLFDCPAIELGDSMSLLGTISMVNYANDFFVDGNYVPGAYLTFKYGLIANTGYENWLDNWFSPHSPIFSMQVQRSAALTGYSWYGFTTRAHYCELEPNSDLCI